MTRWPRYLGPGWLAAYTVGFLLWGAIIDLAGWWPLVVIAYLYLLLIAAVVSMGGVSAAVRWIEERRWR